jgi:hypothetical protein
MFASFGCKIGCAEDLMRCARVKERGMTSRRRRGLHTASDLTIYDASTAALRRGISPAWRRLGQEDEREMEEGGEGFL